MLLGAFLRHPRTPDLLLAGGDYVEDKRDHRPALPFALRLVDGFRARLDEKYTFLDAMTYGYKSILSSPHFLLMTPVAAASSS